MLYRYTQQILTGYDPFQDSPSPARNTDRSIDLVRGLVFQANPMVSNKMKEKIEV